MTSTWSTILSEASTNIDLNPSFELTGNFAAFNSATVTRDTTYSKSGIYCAKIVPGAVDRGITLTTSAATNAKHQRHFYARGVTGTLSARMDGATWHAMTIVGGATGGWVRYQVEIPQAEANASVATNIKNSVNETWYMDCTGCEAKDGYYTTWGDGDQPGWRWNGLRHGSTSTRDAQYRLGGREVDLQSYLGIRVIQEIGWGMPDQINNLQDMSINPGAIYQSTKIGTRTLVLTLDFTTGPAVVTTIPALHQRRQAFINAVKSSRNRGDQPFVLACTDSNTASVTRTAYGQFRYVTGLQGLDISSGGTVLEAQGKVPVTFLAVDPYFYADDRDTAVLDFTDSITGADYAMARINGNWQALGTGFNGIVYTVAVDKARGRVFFGGAFTTANGVTVNRVCYWNGTTFVAMGGGTPGTGGGVPDVFGLAVAPNGDVWVFGAFTTAGGAATKGIARWNSSTDTFTVYNLSTGSFQAFNCGAVDGNGKLYAAGSFTNWNGDAASDYIVQYDGTTWSAVGTSPFGAADYPASAYAMAIDSGNRLIAGSTAAAAVLRRWDGSSWTTLGTATGTSIFVVTVMPSGDYLVGGNFSVLGGVTAAKIARYNGSTFVTLGSGLAGGDVYSISITSSGLILVTGSFTSASGLTLSDRLAFWNGFTWSQVDIDPPSTPTLYGSGALGDDVFISYSTTGTGVSSGITTVSPTATEFAYPVVTITGPTTANTTCILQWLENQSTGQVCYFNLTINAGETITIDFRPNSDVLISSDWRGEITDNPLDNSDFDFKLLPSPSSNSIAAFITGTTTGVNLLMSNDVPHLAVDGVA